MFKEHPLFFRRWGCPEQSGMQDRPGFFRVAWALLSLLSAFPLLGAGLPQSRALPKSHSLLPAAIKGAVAAVIRRWLYFCSLNVAWRQEELRSGVQWERRQLRASGHRGLALPGSGAALCSAWSSLQCAKWIPFGWTWPGAFCPGASPVLGCSGLCGSAAAPGCPGRSSPALLWPGTIYCGMGRMGTAPLTPDWGDGMIARKNSNSLVGTQLIMDWLKLENISKVNKSNQTIFEYIWGIVLLGLL